MQNTMDGRGHFRWPGALIVDDIPTTQQIGMLAMKAAGFRAMTASDGKEAVDLVAQNQFDVVLMDINMPRMNGLEATEVIRSEELQTKRHRFCHRGVGLCRGVCLSRGWRRCLSPETFRL